MTTTNPSSTGRLGQGTERGAYVYIVIFSGALYTFLLVAPDLATKITTQFNASATQVGLLFSAELGVFSLASVPAYLWLPRANLRVVTYLCTTVVVGGNFLSGFTNTLPELIIARVITAAAGGSIIVIVLSVCSRTTNSSRAFGLFVVVQLIVGAVFLALFPLVFSGSGVRAVYWTLAGLTAIGFTVADRIDPNIIRHAAPEAPRVTAAPEKAGRSPRGRMTLGLLADLMFFVGVTGVWTFIGRIAITAGNDAGTTSLVLSLATICGVLSALLATLVGDTPHSSKYLFFGYLGLGASITLLFGRPALVQFIIAAVVFKFTWTVVLPYLLSGLAKLSSSPHLMNTVNIAGGTGLMIGPLLAGYLIDHTGGFTVMLVVAIGSIGTSTVLLALALRGIRGISSRSVPVPDAPARPAARP